MGLSFKDRISHAFNVFLGRDEVDNYDLGQSSYSGRAARSGSRFSSERTIVASIYNRISVDVAAVDLLHVRVDDNERFVEEIDSGLNNCLKVEANIDQSARAFRQDIALSLFEQGVIAVVPVDTSINPELSSGYDIRTMRVGTIVGWYPQHVRCRLYDERSGERKEVVLAKKDTTIIENPFYTVMNEPNSTLQRLIRKLGYLDAIDKQSGSGKLDIIIQLPYVIKSQARREQAEQRRKMIEDQLSGSQYGIAYTDGTEKITQLNRAAENNLLKQVQYLTELLYSELGITQEVMNGTADEATMLNYYNRTVEPVLAAISEGMIRTFLTKTARTQKQTILYIRDPFKLVPIASIADIADKFTRNEILTSNEVRGLIGFRPSSEPNADELRNKNIPEPIPPTEPDKSAPEEVPTEDTETEQVSTKVPQGDSQNGS